MRFSAKGHYLNEEKGNDGNGDEDFGACRILRQKIKKDRLIKCQPGRPTPAGKAEATDTIAYQSMIFRALGIPFVEINDSSIYLG